MANIVELREMSNEKLEEMLENSQEEMFNLRFQHAAARIADTTRIRAVRREMAQIQSVLHKRALAIETAAATPEIAAALEGKEWEATASFVYEASSWAVQFSADGSNFASAKVDLNRKRRGTRRMRAAKAMREAVLSYEIN